MKKNFMNPEMKINAFDLGKNIVMLSALTAAEKSVLTTLGVDLSKEKSGYIYSINQEQVNQ